jgi:hypothetical protein
MPCELHRAVGANHVAGELHELVGREADALRQHAADRAPHFAACVTGQIHIIRTDCWTVGSLILTCVTVRTLLAAAVT